MTEPTYLTETRTDQMGEWVDVWHVSPPDKGVPFRVIRDKWDDDLSTRHIFEIEFA
jgi:hypothetical protein